MMLENLVLNLAIAANPQLDEPRYLDIFWSACAEGKVALKNGEARQRDFNDLPFGAQLYYSGSKKIASVYELGDENSAYLVFYENPKPFGYEYKSGCAIVARDMSLVNANKYISKKYTGAEIPLEECKPNVRYECDSYGFYFNFLPRKLDFHIKGTELSGDFKVIQLSKMTELSQEYYDRERSLRNSGK